MASGIVYHVMLPLAGVLLSLLPVEGARAKQAAPTSTTAKPTTPPVSSASPAPGQAGPTAAAAAGAGAASSVIPGSGSSTTTPTSTSVPVTVDHYALYFALIFYTIVITTLMIFVYLRLRRMRHNNRTASVYDAILSLFTSSTSGTRGAAQSGLYFGGPAAVHVASGGGGGGGGHESKRGPKRNVGKPGTLSPKPASLTEAPTQNLLEQPQGARESGFMDNMGRRLVSLFRGNTAVAFGPDGGAARKAKSEDTHDQQLCSSPEVNSGMRTPGLVEKRDAANNCQV